MKSHLIVTLFGTPQFTYTYPEKQYPETPITGFVSNKARALLIYLAVTARTHSRDALSELLWADTPTTKRENLKKVLSNLRRMDGVTLLEEGRHQVALDPQSYWLDVAEFSRIANHETSPDSTAWQQAIALYHDDFLAGFNPSLSLEFEEWALSEQTRLKMQMVDLLRRLANQYAQQHEPTKAISTLRRLVQVEPWQEEAHRQLIELLAQNNDVASALAQFERCKENLRDELDVEPSPILVELVAKIRGGTFKAAPRSQPKQPSKPFQPKQTKTSVEFPLVGREAEWQTITERWTNLRNSHLLCIGGEAGIGKTRLAEELLLLAEADGVAVARTRSHELQGQLAYGPITDWLRSASLQHALNQLDDVWRTEVARLLPELLIDGLSSPQPMTEGWQRKRFFDALVHTVASVDGPLLLLLDDLQWSDADTLEWIQYLVESGERPILVAGTVRLNEIDPEHPLHRVRQQLQRQDKFTAIPLSPLSAIATNQLGAVVTDATLADDLADRLFRDTAGNPLFVIESMRGGPTEIVSDEAAFSPYPQPEVDNPLPMPTKMYSVIQSRLAQLSPQAQKLAQLGATIGRAFDVTLLATAAESDEDVVLMILDELWQRRIIKEVDAVHFDFSHDRIRDVAYAEIGPIKRRVLHRSVASALEAIYSDNTESISGQLATHCKSAGLIEGSIKYSHAAAKQALELSANMEAIAYLKDALDLLLLQPESENTLKQEVALQTTLAIPVATITGRASSEVQEIYQRVQTLCKRLGESPSFPVLRGLTSIYLVRGDFVQSLDLSENLLKQAIQSGNNSDIAESHFIVGANNFWLGQLVNARKYFEETLKYYSLIYHEGHTKEYGTNPGIVCQVLLSITLWCLGYPEQAEKLGEEAIDLASEVGHTSSYAYVLTMYCRVPQCLGQPEKVHEFAQKAFDYTTEHSFQFWLAVSKVFRGWANAELGDPEAGIAEIIEGIDAFRKTGGSASTTWFLGLAASVYNKWLDDPTNSFSSVEEGLDIVQKTSERIYEAELWRLRGELYLGIKIDEKKAEAAFQKAIEVARSQEAKSWELRATTSLCHLWQKQGKASDAHRLLSEIYGWFTEGFDTADLREAKALLDALASHTEVTVALSPSRDQRRSHQPASP